MLDELAQFVEATAVVAIPEYAKPIVKDLEAAFPGRVWVVGSVARAFRLGEDINAPKDTDILVDTGGLAALRKVIQGQLETVTTNSFGGYKLTLDCGKQIDVWAGPVGDYLHEVPLARHGIAINYRWGTVLTTGEFITNHADDRVLRPQRLPEIGS